MCGVYGERLICMGKGFMWYVCEIIVYGEGVQVVCVWVCVDVWVCVGVPMHMYTHKQMQSPEEDIGCPAVSLPYSFKTETLTEPEARPATTGPADALVSMCTQVATFP